MNKLKTALRWFQMLTKRLYKKPVFLVLLVLLPALVLGYGRAAREDAGMLTVVLAQEGTDPLAEEMIGELLGSSQLIRFIRADSPEDARTLVFAGKADAAWLFPADTQARLRVFSRHPQADNAFITALVREDNVALHMARERLSGVVFRHCSRLVYLDYIRENVPGLAEVSDEALLETYDATKPEGNLFAFDQTDAAMQNAQKTHYLTAPVRGLLAIVILLAGLATALYYGADEHRGTFAWMPANRRWLAEWGCQWVTLLNISLAAALSLALGGLWAGFGREAAALAVYCLCCAGFCMLLRQLLGRALGVSIPVLLVAAMVLCPVFFDLGDLRAVQYLLPPTYYMNGLYDPAVLALMGLYGLLCLALALGLGRLKGQK